MPKDVEEFLSSTQALLLRRFVFFPACHPLPHSIQIEDQLSQMARLIFQNQCRNNHFNYESSLQFSASAGRCLRTRLCSVTHELKVHFSPVVDQ